MSNTKSEPRGAELVGSIFDGTLPDPYPVYAALREIGDGVHWADVPNAYMVFRYEDVRTVASDPSVYSSDVFWDSAQSIHDPNDPRQVHFVDVNSRLFMFSDPPTHTRIRSSFKRAFTPPAMKQWQPIVERMTTKLFDAYQPGDELDIVPTLAADVPVAVIASILGVPEDKHSKFREWSAAYASTFDPMVQGERRNQALKTSLELMDYLAELIEERRANPQNDLISVLLSTETTAGDHLTDLELLATLTLLLVAGNETTTNAIGAGVNLMLEYPDVRAEIARNLELLPGAIEEVLRYEPPLPLMIRKPTRDVRIGDHDIPANTMLMLCAAAANRDPRRFENPEVFDIHRTENRHLSFFHGIHFCVGAALARLELQVVLEQLLVRYPGLSRGSAPAVRRSKNSTVRGFETLPVRL